jgi:hypothetical protein
VKTLLFVIFLSSLSAIADAQNASTPSDKKVTRVRQPKAHQETDTVGVINNQVITYADFKSLLATRVRARIEATHDSVVTDSEYSMLVDSAWNASVRYILMQQEIQKQKLSVSEMEARNYVLAKPPSFIRQQFLDSAGRFDSAQWVFSAKDKRNADVMDPLVRSIQIQLETEKFLSAIFIDAKSETDKEKRYADWEKHALARARIVDRRLNFGFY